MHIDNDDDAFPWQSLVKLEGWESVVTIVSSDMRSWDAPEKADILVLIYLIWIFYMQISP